MGGGVLGFPTRLRAAIESRLAAHGAGLVANSAALSARYRSGGASRGALHEDALVAAYLAARMPATFAAAAETLERIAEQAPAFAPATLLDVGAGTGAASLAAAEVFPEIERAVLLDHMPAFRAAARELFAESPHDFLAGAAIESWEVGAEGPLPSADLVIASYLLGELAPRVGEALVARLWAAAGGVLLLVEPGTPAGFARIRGARAALIAAGATVLAPCTHELACPIGGTDWCHFSVRLARSRTHRQAKGASAPFEDERFSYVAVGRLTRAAGGGRIVAPVRESKAGLGFRVCEGGALAERFVPARDRAAHAAHRRKRWGDLI